MSLSKRMITPTVCGLEGAKEALVDTMQYIIVFKVNFQNAKLVNMYTINEHRDGSSKLLKLTPAAPYLPTGADPWNPLHCSFRHTTEGLWEGP